MTFRSVLSSIYGPAFHICDNPSIDNVTAAVGRFDCIEFHTLPWKGDFVHMHAELRRRGRWDLLDGTDIFTMLREPVDQAISQYYYMIERKALIEPAYTLNGVRFPRSLEEYADAPWHFNNQLAFLAGKYQLACKESVHRTDLDEVRDVFHRLQIHTGITERYSEALHVFEKVTGRRIPDRRIENQNQNLNRPPLEAIPAHVKEKIRRQSELDIELYEFARGMFEREIAALGPAPVYRFVNDASHLNQLRERGFIIQPFLNAAETELLLRLHLETTPEVPSDYYVSAFGTNPAAKRRIFEGITAVIASKVQRLAPGYRILMASFVTKRANSKRGRLGLHQDYSLVDQSRGVGLNVWCPLCDVDSRNGCLRVAERSHVFGHISATPPNPSPYDDLRGRIESDYMTEIPMGSGEAFLFDTGLLHATDENETSTDRTSVFLNLVPENVAPRLHFWDREDPDRLKIYEVDSEFMLQLPPNQYLANPERLGAKFIGTTDYAFQKLTPAGLAARLLLRTPVVERLAGTARRAVAFLVKSQRPDGEFQTEFCAGKRESTDGQLIEDLVFDSSPFVTSIALHSLAFARHLDPAVDETIARGLRFLRSEMDPGGLWRYWSRSNPKRVMIPPDLDDTACISHLLRTNGVAIPDNRWLFRESRDARGAFYTWLYKADSPRKCWLSHRTHGQAFSHTDQIWQWTAKKDVCAVVNANAVLYLGETRHTKRAINYLKRMLLEGSEDREIVFYAHKFSLYYMLSRACFHGVAAFNDQKMLLTERIRSLARPDGSFGDELLTALAICSLLNLDPASGADGLGRSIEFLLGTQQPDGSWRRIAMYGGPPVPTTFGSADLTTALCVEALARYGSVHAGTS